MSATEARVHFGEVLKAVAEQGDSVIVERAGRRLAAVIPLSDYEQLPSRSDRWARSMEGVRRLREYLQAERAAGRLHDADLDVEGDLRRSREERDEQLLHGTLPGR
jgi:prevent-host-death family protein